MTFERRLGRHAARGRRPAAVGHARAGALATPATRPTCRSPTSPAARRGSRGRPTASRCPPTTAGRPGCSCRTSTSGRAPSGSSGLRAARPRRARVLGAQRLPRPRRPLARAALPGRLTGARRLRRVADAVADARRSSTIRDETPRAKTFRLALPEPSRHRAGPALRRPAHRARRLHRVALVLGRVGARRHERDRAHRRAARRTARSRRSCTTTSIVGDELEVRGPIGGWFVWDGDDAGAARRRRLGRRAAHGDAAPRRAERAVGPRAPVVSVRTPDDLYYADELAGPETTSSTRASRRRVARAGSPAVATSHRRSRAQFAAGGDRVRVRLGAASPTPRRDCSSTPASGGAHPVERFGPTG